MYGSSKPVSFRKLQGLTKRAYLNSYSYSNAPFSRLFSSKMSNGLFCHSKIPSVTLPAIFQFRLSDRWTSLSSDS